MKSRLKQGSRCALALGFMLLFPSSRLATSALLGPVIRDAALESVPGTHFPLIHAAVESASEIKTVKLYFRAEQYPDFYYVEMTEDRDRRGFIGILPVAKEDTRAIVYFIEAMDVSFTSARSPLHRVSVTRSVLPGSSFYAGEDPRLLVGATREGMARVPPGFEPKGIREVVDVRGRREFLKGGREWILGVLGGAAGAALGAGYLKESPTSTTTTPLRDQNVTTSTSSTTTTSTVPRGPTSTSSTSTTTTTSSTTTSTTTTTIRVLSPADLSLDKRGPTSSGCTIAYTLAVYNKGERDATSVAVTDDLPAGATVQSMDKRCSRVKPNQVVCDLDTVKARTTDVVSITVRMGEFFGLVVNDATVSSPSDADKSNNSDDVTTDVGCLLLQEGNLRTLITADLRVSGGDGTASGSIRVNDRETLHDESGIPFPHAVASRPGENRVEAVVTSGEESEVIWRFDLRGAEHYVSGSLSVIRGQVVSLDGYSVVFRLTAPGERVAFTYFLKP